MSGDTMNGPASRLFGVPHVGRYYQNGTAFRTALVVASFVALAGPVGAQQPKSTAENSVLFVCEHGTVKSLLAKTLFEEYARERGLNFTALSRGTKVDSAVPPWMLKALANERVDLGSWKPQALRVEDLNSAAYVVSFDVSHESTAAARAPRAQWDGLPSVSADFAKGRDAIRVRVRQLVDSLKLAAGPTKP